VIKRKKFNAHPFAYHQEIDLEISTLTNLGLGLGRVPVEGSSWVVMVPFTLPGERVRARIYRNHKNYSEADLITVLSPSPSRTEPRCALFTRCGGCQYQHLAYAEQLEWKRRQVAELLEHMAGVTFPVDPVVGSPRPYGYRSKITPHFAAPRTPEDASTLPIGFLRQGTRFEIVDVPRCEIGTDAINESLAAARASVRERAAGGEYQRGATLLFREAGGVVTTDYEAAVTEDVAGLRLHFLARDFFQNNPFLLPAFVAHVRSEAAATGARFLADCYCGSGLFALGCAGSFEKVAGIEISETSIAFARDNASANGITNAYFQAGDASALFAGLQFPAGETVVVIDPPRKGCDDAFLDQIFAYRPRGVVYVSCDPATQMRDLKRFTEVGYGLKRVQPFDLFPQTRHLECVMTLGLA
jgi:tRNA/tmRNA/rRNA uracil-C5-methylase (TrmA/RlmC/RlmD family)